MLSAVLALTVACRLDKLLESPRPPGLGVAPSRVLEFADSGSGELRTVALTVSSSASRLTWTAHEEAGSAWLNLTDAAGSTPDTLQFTLNPTGLDPGTYRDAIILVPDSSTAPNVRVPVELRIDPVPPNAGTLTVTSTTIGGDPDPDGYTVTVNGVPNRHIDNDGRTTYTLAGGSYTVALSGLASNCSVSNGSASRTVTVSTGQTTTEMFEVDCPTPPPQTGDLTVSASTTGAAPDPNGYTVTVGDQGRTIGNNGSTTYPLAPGDYTVDLGDVAANCIVTDGTSRTATVTSGQTAAVTFQVNCPAAGATRLLFSTQPTTTTAGATITPSVQVTAVDAQGSTVTTFTGNVRLDIRDNPGGGTLAGNVNASAVSGVATFPGLSINRSGSDYTLAAHASGLADGVSDAFAINPGAPDHLVFTVQPSNAQVNRPIAPAVRVTMLDIHGNVATSFTSTVFMEIDHDGALVPPATLSAPGTQRAAAAGVATFEDLRIDKVGVGYTLVASAVALKGGFSAPFDITATTPPPPPPATRLEFSQHPPNPMVLSTAFSVTVQALNDQGGIATNYSGPVQLTLQGPVQVGGLTGTTTVNAVGGVARFTNLRVTGLCVGCSILASASGPSGATSSSFNVILGLP